MNPSDRIRATPELPTLPQHLIDLIGEYGMSRTDGDSDVARIHKWETLIAGIKAYARACIETNSELLLKEREELLKDAAKLEWLINANEADFAAMEYETPEFRRIYIEQAMKQDLEGENQS